ncbi:MAG: hypothetical protein HFK06_01075 [Clostridia bacterium]|nr:hypothetical protein [Clostridia bacterium]
MSKKFRCALLAGALSAVVAFSAGFSACNIKTSHPRAKITVDFNNISYDIEYTLYRNMYPQTVQHFIELADAGFYDNMIVHNYNTSTDWFTGAYSYNAVSETSDEVYATYDKAYGGGENALLEYLENNSKEEEYYALAANNTLTPTVFKKIGYDDKGKPVPQDALATLIGEFSANDHKIEKNPLEAKMGCLKMFYYEKDESNKKATIVNSAGQILEHDYQYNCATSIFSMQVGNTTSYSKDKYCVFATLRNDKAQDSLKDLMDAIADYIDDYGYSGNFTTSVETSVDKLDTYSKPKKEEKFTMSRTPLVIKTVKITKY